MSEKEKHKFWSTQPVDGATEGEISKCKGKDPVQLQLPAGFTFVTLTLHDIDDIYHLLKDAYVEDMEEQFRLCYSKELLEWQFTGQKQKKEYLLGVKKDNKLYGFTSAKEHNICVNGKEVKMVSVNFLCIAQVLRKRRLAPLIIKEITRRANLHGIYQAVFTGGIELPFEISAATYYHKILNRKKLIKLNYCGRSSNITKEFEITNWTIRNGTREMTGDDTIQVFALYNEKSEGYKIYEKMEIEEFKHNFTNRHNLFYTLVYEDGGKITEFGSFYILDTLCKESNARIKTAYLYYYYSRSVSNDMIKDLVLYAKNSGCDMFNALNIMDNERFFEELHFETGNGTLHYYFYNWKTAYVNNDQVHLVLM